MPENVSSSPARPLQAYGVTPWAAGWRWEFRTNDHRWFPPQTIVDAYKLDTSAPTVAIDRLKKLTCFGLKSAAALELLLKVVSAADKA